MTTIPTYEELEQRAKELEQETIKLKRVEEALKESELRFRLLYENAPLGYQSLDENGRFKEVNQAWLDTLGYSREEVMGKSFGDFLHPDWVGHFKENFPRFKAIGEILGVEFEMVKKDGSVIIVQFDGRIGRDEKGGFKQTHCILHNTTDRQRAEKALHESEEELRKISMELSLGLSEVFQALKEISSGDPEVRIPETSELEIIAKLKHMVNLTAENLGEIVSLSHEFAIGFAEHFEVLRRVSTGEMTARVSGTSQVELLESLGKMINQMVESVSREMADRVKAEEEKRKLEAQVHHAQKMEALGTLSAGLVHDFNNLLMGIQADASMMLRDIDSSNPNHERLKGIKQQVRSGAELIRHLLRFASRMEYEIKPTDLTELLNNTSDMFGRTNKGIRIRKKYQEDVWEADVDRGQIEQVLLNLFINATEAMHESGELYLEAENVTLDEKYVEPHKVQAGNYVKVLVADTGVGMDEETQQRIFEPFFTTKKTEGGTGLGLASAYGIIRNHGGIIDVCSDKGKGTTFSIYLPAHEK